MTFSCLPTALTSVFFSFAHWLTTNARPCVCPWCLPVSSSPADAAPSLPGSAPASSAKTSARAMSPSVPSVEPSRAWRSRPSTWSSPWSRTSVCGSASTTRRPNATVPGWRATPVSSTIPVLARRVRKHLYGHIWVTLAALGEHPDWGTIALPLQAQLYIRAIDVPSVPPRTATALPHQTGTGCAASAVAETLGRQPLRGTLGEWSMVAMPRGRFCVRSSWTAGWWSAACAGTLTCATCRRPNGSRASGTAADLRQESDLSGRDGR